MSTATDAPSAGERAAEAALRARWLETRDRTHYDGCALQDARCALAVVFALLDTTRADLAAERGRLWEVAEFEAGTRDAFLETRDMYVAECERTRQFAADLATAREENARLARLVRWVGLDPDLPIPGGLSRDELQAQLTAAEAERDALHTQLDALRTERER